MASSTIEQHLTPRRRTRRAWVIYAIAAVLLILRAVFEFAVDGAAGHVVNAASTVTHGGTILMTLAGVLTVAYLPVALAVTVEDRKKWYGRPVVMSPTDTGVIHMTTRPRSDDRHKVARRPVAYWFRRVPVALAVMVAILFWPLTGASMANRWQALPGGHAFTDGWRLGLVAAVIGVLIVLAEPWISTTASRHRRLPGPTILLATNLVALLAAAAALIIA